MPTRIALKKTSPPPRRCVLAESSPAPTVPPSSAFRSGFSNSSSTEFQPSHSRQARRQLPGFRSSILRELKGREHDEEFDVEKERVSTDDIRGSPRLLGYVFSMIAGAVMLVSVVQFYRESKIPFGYNGENVSAHSNKFFYLLNGVVYRWKLWGAIYISSAGVALSLVTVLVHFDTVVAPKLWLSLFRDGSLAERNWILFLIVFWAAGVFVCTSTLSVGESQANVFFTSWIAFASTALNYGVWRESAGLKSLTQLVAETKRETTYNWMWTGIFSCIFAGSVTDMYVNRDDIVLRGVQGEELNLIHKDWVIIVSVVWAEFALCIAAILLNEGFEHSWKVCRVSRPSGKYRCVFGWRQLEGFVILVDTGCKFWVILKYAGVDGVINGLSNAYFGVWGSFFSGVSALGTWLRENKNIEYIVREEDTENADEEDGSAA